MWNNSSIAHPIFAVVLCEDTVKLELSDHHDARLQDSPTHITEAVITVNKHIEGERKTNDKCGEER